MGIIKYIRKKFKRKPKNNLRNNQDHIYDSARRRVDTNDSMTNIVVAGAIVSSLSDDSSHSTGSHESHSCSDSSGSSGSCYDGGSSGGDSGGGCCGGGGD